MTRMRRSPLSLLALQLLLLGQLPATPARAEPTPFNSRVPYEPLVRRLEHAAQSPDKIVRPASARDLLQLQSGQRYKFILDGAGRLAIAPEPADAPGNEYAHPILAGGAPVATAGGITVEHAPRTIARVVLDRDSQAYCPSFASLKSAAAALARLGVAQRSIALADRAPRCAAQ